MIVKRYLPAILAGALVGLAGPAIAADEAPADAGRYVATAAGCSSCHTAPGGEPFAGGLVLHTPFGPLATPNITQDEETGIGGWSKADFANAIHNGLDDEGAPLYPAMPYLHYTRMTDADLDALWDYVSTIAPVKNAVEVNRLPFPFDVRDSLYVWRMLYFREGRFEPDAAKSAEWNRGAYLVDALAHCGACHTPRDPLGGPLSAERLEGGAIEEWYAPDISNGPGSVIADWDVARLEAFLAGNDGMNHVAVGSMGKVVDELSRLTKEDVLAIAVYLKDQPAAEAEAPREGMAVTPEREAAWKALFETRCVNCHGADGTGSPGVAASLVGSGAVLAAEPDNVIAVILEGIGPEGTYGVMPSFREELSDAEIAGVANYVRTSWGNDAPANADAERVAGLRNVTHSDPAALDAATCPNVPADRVTDAMRKTLADLAGREGLERTRMASLLSAYEAKNPDASTTAKVVDLGGLYCQDVVKTGVGKAAVITRQLAFMAMMTDLAAEGAPPRAQ